MTIGHENYDKPFDVAPRTHVGIFGKTGTGKSALLERMILSDIKEGRGVGLIDPHRALVDAILGQIPKDRLRDVIYLNPMEFRVPTVPLLRTAKREDIPLLVSTVVDTMKSIWGDSWGPRMEDILRSALFVLAEQPQGGLMTELPRLLTDRKFRALKLEHSENPIINMFFADYDSWNEKFKVEAISPVLNKVRAFLVNPYLRHVVSQHEASFDFREAMDTGKIVLCSLQKGVFGTSEASLLGSTIVSKFSQAALARSTDEPTPFTLYVDKIQNFIHGVDFPTILAEARKYGLFLTVATQTQEQIPPESRAAIFGNCSTLITFRVSGADAIVLAQEFSTRFTAESFQDLPNYYCRAKTMRDGAPTDTYTIKTIAPGKGTMERRNLIIKQSLQRYGRTRKE